MTPLNVILARILVPRKYLTELHVCAMLEQDLADSTFIKKQRVLPAMGVARHVALRTLPAALPVGHLEPLYPCTVDGENVTAGLDTSLPIIPRSPALPAFPLAVPTVSAVMSLSV